MEQRKDLVTSQQIQEVFESPLAVIADAGIIAIAEQAEKRIEAFEKIKRYALRTTNLHDWVNIGGNPYLQDSGANKVARAFGVSWRLEPPEIEYLEGTGGHFIVTVKGDFAIGGAVIQAVGSRSSSDPFFIKYKHEGEKREVLPPSEIDRGDVIKAAVTNCTGNGVKKLLGLMNLTWQDLEGAGISQASVGGYGFKKGGKPQQTAKPAQKATETKEAPEQPTSPDAPATEPQVRAIHAILRDRLSITDELAKAEKVANSLGLKDIPTSMSKLTKRQASDATAKLLEEANAKSQ